MFASSNVTWKTCSMYVEVEWIKFFSVLSCIQSFESHPLLKTWFCYGISQLSFENRWNFLDTVSATATIRCSKSGRDPFFDLESFGDYGCNETVLDVKVSLNSKSIWQILFLIANYFLCLVSNIRNFCLCKFLNSIMFVMDFSSIQFNCLFFNNFTVSRTMLSHIYLVYIISVGCQLHYNILHRSQVKRITFLNIFLPQCFSFTL